MITVRIMEDDGRRRIWVEVALAAAPWSFRRVSELSLHVPSLLGYTSRYEDEIIASAQPVGIGRQTETELRILELLYLSTVSTAASARRINPRHHSFPPPLLLHPLSA